MGNELRAKAKAVKEKCAEIKDKCAEKIETLKVATKKAGQQVAETLNDAAASALSAVTSACSTSCSAASSAYSTVCGWVKKGVDKLDVYRTEFAECRRPREEGQR